MSRKRSVLHSEQGHRHRNYKRRMRNLLIEITLIVILTFVAINFIKKDEQMSKVSGVSGFNQEEQQQIIEQEMQSNIPKKEIQKQLKVPEQSNDSIIIIKAVLNYHRENNKTIINFDVKNTSDIVEEHRLYLALLDCEQKQITETYLNVQYLDTNQQTRINIVLDGDFSEAEEIKLLEEK